MLSSIESFAEGMPGGFFVYKAGGNEELLYANSVMVSLFGCDDYEDFKAFVGNSFRGIVYPDDYILTNHSIDVQVDVDQDHFDHVVYRIKRKDGQIRWINDYGRLVDLEGVGKVFYVFVADETEAHGLQAESSPDRQLVDAMDAIHLALGSGDWSMTFNADAQMTACSWSQRFREMLGYSSVTDFPNQLESWSDLLHPDDKERVLTHYWDVVRDYSGRKTYDIYYRLQTLDKGERWFRAIGRLTRREDGSPIAFYGIFLDVDNEYRSKMEEKAATDNLVKALASIYNNVFVVDLAAGTSRPVRTSSNLSLMPEADYTVKDLPYAMGTYMQHNVHPDDWPLFEQASTVEGLRKLLDKNSSYTLRYRVVKGGAVRHMEMQVVKPSEERDEVAIGFRDISSMVEDEMRIQKALQDAFDAAEAANHAKSDFLQTMSHDIRTPMNGIIGMTAIAAAHIDDKERVADSLQKITQASRHLLSLINEVLDMSKIESGKISLSEEEFDLPDLVDDLIAMVRPQALEHKHQLIVDIKDVEHELVIGDSLRIQQVFVNLMSNAIKYTPDGGRIKLSIREIPCKQLKTGCYEFVFADNGIGMSPEFLEHVFEPFARAEDGRTSKVQGTGLGMPIAKNIVNMMGGDIKVESQLGQGTKFVVTFYLKLQESQIADDARFVDLRVLVADDDEMSVESTVDVLEDLGMKADGVRSGQEALERVASCHRDNDDYHAVILDWQMPGMDGVETARAIRAKVGDSVPIIILSAYDWSDIELEARSAGVDAFISKPLFKSKLAHLFGSLMCRLRPGVDVAADQAGSLQQGTESPYQAMGNLDLHGRKCLLAEDNDLNAEIAMEILGETGLEVTRVSDGLGAYDAMLAAKDGAYDLVLMDIQMPKMNGYDATRAIRGIDREYCKTVPIFAMTANTFADDVQAAKAAGMDEHVAKPLKLNVLARLLERYLQ